MSYLAPDFRAPNLGIDRDGIAETEISARLKAYGIKTSIITRYESRATGKEATTAATFITQLDAPQPIRTSWQLFWRDIEGRDWQLEEADLQKIGDAPFSRDAVIPKGGM